MRYHFYMFTPSPTLSPPPTLRCTAHMRNIYKWVKEKCVYLKIYGAFFLFLSHFLCYPRFSYRRYKTEKYISQSHTKPTHNITQIKSKFKRRTTEKQNTHTRKIRPYTQGNGTFRKKIEAHTYKLYAARKGCTQSHKIPTHARETTHTPATRLGADTQTCMQL